MLSELRLTTDDVAKIASIDIHSRDDHAE